jgi:hypothetical protein
MDTPCPDPASWTAWWEDRLPAADRARLAPHLAGCDACRQELAALAEARPAPVDPARLARRMTLVRPRPRWTALRIAAGLLLAVSAAFAWKALRPPLPQALRSDGTPAHASAAPQARLGGTGRLAAADAPAEILLGLSAQFTLAPGSRGDLGSGGAFRLERGEAWAESAGELVHLRLAGWEGVLEFKDAAVAARVAGPASLGALLLNSAQASEEPAWALSVLRGEAVVREGGVARTLAAGASLGSLPPPGASRLWQPLPGMPCRVRDAVRTLLPSAPSSSFIVEYLVRKRDRTAEAAALFRAGGNGKGRQVLLGAYLPSEGDWVRLRLENRSDRIRILAGDREVLACAPGALEAFSYPASETQAWALKAWGGDLEVREARWR